MQRQAARLHCQARRRRGFVSAVKASSPDRRTCWPGVDDRVQSCATHICCSATLDWCSAIVTATNLRTSRPRWPMALLRPTSRRFSGPSCLRYTARRPALIFLTPDCRTSLSRYNSPPSPALCRVRDVVGDVRLTRFLRGSDGNISRASKAFETFLDWREEFGADELRESTFISRR